MMATVSDSASTSANGVVPAPVLQRKTKSLYSREPRYSHNPLAFVFDREAARLDAFHEMDFNFHNALLSRGFDDGHSETEEPLPRTQDLTPAARRQTRARFQSAELEQQVSLHEAWRSRERQLLRQRKSEALQALRTERRQRRRDAWRQLRHSAVNGVVLPVRNVVRCARGGVLAAGTAAAGIAQAVNRTCTSVAEAWPPPSKAYMNPRNDWLDRFVRHRWPGQANSLKGKGGRDNDDGRGDDGDGSAGSDGGGGAKE